VNIRRGAFRLWVIASVLFVVGMGIYSYSGIHDEFRNAYTNWDAEFAKYGGWTEWPVPCPQAAARGIIGTDYNERDGNCWYKTTDFRKLYPEYNDLGDHDLSAKLYAKIGQPLTQFHPWRKLLTIVAVVLACPLAVLALGWGMLWASAGFKP